MVKPFFVLWPNSGLPPNHRGRRRPDNNSSAKITTCAPAVQGTLFHICKFNFNLTWPACQPNKIHFFLTTSLTLCVFSFQYKLLSDFQIKLNLRFFVTQSVFFSVRFRGFSVLLAQQSCFCKENYKYAPSSVRHSPLF